MLGRKALSETAYIARQLIGNTAEQPSLRRLCARLLGTTPKIDLSGATGRLIEPVGGQGWQVTAAPHLIAEKARFVVAHELAHWVWEVEAGYNGPDLEARCDALAAAIVMPPAAVVRVTNSLGLSDVHAIARALRTTQSAALLRLGEVHDVPTALLRRRRSTIIRGPFVRWPVPLSWQRAKRAPGIVKVRVRDEPQRFGVMFG